MPTFLTYRTIADESEVVHFVEGGVVYACIQALISTLRKRGMNVFSQLRELKLSGAKTFITFSATE